MTVANVREPILGIGQSRTDESWHVVGGQVALILWAVHCCAAHASEGGGVLRKTCASGLRKDSAGPMEEGDNGGSRASGLSGEKRLIPPAELW